MPSLPSLVERLEVVSLGVEVLPCVELELFFCFVKEFLPDMLSDLEVSCLGSDLFPDDSETWDSGETSPFHSQYRALIA